MSFTRRSFLRASLGAGAGALLAPLVGCRKAPIFGPRLEGPTFEHGVASADPLSDAVLLWTRVTPNDAAGQVIEVSVEVATDPGFQDTILHRATTTAERRDYTVQFDATGLQPSTTYYFRFRALGDTSPIGRTRTAGPGRADRLRFGLVACSNYAQGYFHGYRRLAERTDLDAVVHLGDYIYENASKGFGDTYGTVRELEPRRETITLADYRLRYSQYRRDPDLQEAHRQHPFIAMWDDHEFADDPYPGGADAHDSDEGPWSTRLNAAARAYQEWVPARMGPIWRLWRRLEYGGLADLILVDRQRRYLWPAPGDEEVYLGHEQQDWLDREISAGSGRWLLLGQGTRFASREADAVSGASWDEASRLRVLEAVEAAGRENFVVLTGDIHKGEALDIITDPTGYDPSTGVGSRGVELSIGSISAPGYETFPDTPQYFWIEYTYRHYAVLDVTPDALQCDWFGFPDERKRWPELPPDEWRRGFATATGANHWQEAASPAPERTDAPPPAPPPDAGG